MLMAGGIALAVVIAALATPYAAIGAEQGGADQPSKSASLKECFRDSDIAGWVAPDPQTLILRVTTNRYYRVDLAHECSPLRMPDARLITHTHGSDMICTPLDFDLRAAEGLDQFSEPCFVKSISRLGPDEVAALPKRAKP
jgi:hypothetical protein